LKDICSPRLVFWLGLLLPREAERGWSGKWTSGVKHKGKTRYGGEINAEMEGWKE
jgi:hypothetical protein